MIAALIQAADTLTALVPSFSERFNFTLPIMVILFILMFFLLLKSYSTGQSLPDHDSAGRSRKTRI